MCGYHLYNQGGRITDTQVIIAYLHAKSIHADNISGVFYAGGSGNNHKGNIAIGVPGIIVIVPPGGYVISFGFVVAVSIGIIGIRCDGIDFTTH